MVNKQADQILNLLILEEYKARLAVDAAISMHHKLKINLTNFMQEQGLTRVSRIMDVELIAPLPKDIFDALEIDLEDDDTWETFEDHNLKYTGEDGVYHNWLTPAMYEETKKPFAFKQADTPW
jgi:hypothetical protein